MHPLGSGGYQSMAGYASAVAAAAAAAAASHGHGQGSPDLGGGLDHVVGDATSPVSQGSSSNGVNGARAAQYSDINQVRNSDKTSPRPTSRDFSDEVN